MKLIFTLTFCVFSSALFSQITISAAFTGTGSPQQDNIRYFTTNGSEVSAGFTNIFTTQAVSNHEGTAAIGAAFNNFVAVPRFYYYMPYKYNNEGQFSIWVYDLDSHIQNELINYDVNGVSNNNLSFVRLAMDRNGKAWIVAGDLSLNQVYIVSVQTNGVNSISPTGVSIVDSDVQLNGGGLASEFLSGDICVNYDGYIYTLANDNAGKTFLYGGYPNGESTVFTRKFEIKDDQGNAFDGKVTGIALNETGSLYISVNNTNDIPLTKSGLYYIDRNSFSVTYGEVSAVLKWEGAGINDLASNQFPSMAILPLKLKNFTAAYNNEAVQIVWESENETNIKEYSLERLTDGGKFTEIAKVPAKNVLSTQRYSYTDGSLSASVSKIQYRLAVLDNYGQVTYSEIRMITPLPGNNKMVAKFYPNPVAGYLNIELPRSMQQGKIHLSITNITGNNVYNSVIQPGQKTAQVITENFTPGIYNVTLSGNVQVISGQIIKQ